MKKHQRLREAEMKKKALKLELKRERVSRPDSHVLILLSGDEKGQRRFI
jgi:hypothetical protein